MKTIRCSLFASSIMAIGTHSMAGIGRRIRYRNTSRMILNRSPSPADETATIAATRSGAGMRRAAQHHMHQDFESLHRARQTFINRRGRGPIGEAVKKTTR